MNTAIRLGVNIDHVATLRQLRAGTVDYPNLLAAKDLVIRGGAEQLTVHLRGDRRHIQEKDLYDLARERGPLLLNLEMAPTAEMIAIAAKARPEWICIVPERREELTTEGGIDIVKNRLPIEGCVDQVKKSRIKVSVFIEAQEEQIKASKEIGADAVEFHTGAYSLARGADQKKWVDHLRAAAEMAHGLGLHVHAGHGLDYSNLGPILKTPHLEEVNIGHSIVCRAVLVGLLQAVKEMKAIIHDSARS